MAWKSSISFGIGGSGKNSHSGSQGDWQKNMNHFTGVTSKITTLEGMRQEMLNRSTSQNINSFVNVDTASHTTIRFKDKKGRPLYKIVTNSQEMERFKMYCAQQGYTIEKMDNHSSGVSLAGIHQSTQTHTVGDGAHTGADQEKQDGDEKGKSVLDGMAIENMLALPPELTGDKPANEKGEGVNRGENGEEGENLSENAPKPGFGFLPHF